ncbi:MAG: 50S ribosomal protein L22 [Parcubacteria group bacterium]|nr:50S ribosomal protein L22 [Parcubacteria group bacterium]
MEVKATLRNLRIAPRKVRLVADLVRAKSVAEARLQLKFSQARAAKPVLKLIESGVANAEHNFHIDASTLRIKELVIDQGPMLKRYMARAFGRGAEIQKRMSHIRLVLDGQVSATAKPASKPVVTKVGAKTTVKQPIKTADMEKQKPPKMSDTGVKKTDSKKPDPVDPRMQGKARFQRNSK